ncbi:MAG: low molecular weight phosphotyrosine protein phosphatase, partial [Pseudomonadota bacterium]|nr:low molecular weight phosphotyrosine protein phosphatase [Pseudomonadota bacterium]
AQNLSDLKGMQPASSRAHLSLLLDHVDGREGEAVADPYYGDETGFDITWGDVTVGAKGLARTITAKG